MQTEKSKKNLPTNGPSTKQFQSIGTQTEIQSMNYIPPKVLSGFELESEAWLSIFYKPHMVFLLTSLCAIIAYFEIFLSKSYSDSSFINNARMYSSISSLAN